MASDFAGPSASLQLGSVSYFCGASDRESYLSTWPSEATAICASPPLIAYRCTSLSRATGRPQVQSCAQDSGLFSSADCEAARACFGYPSLAKLSHTSSRSWFLDVFASMSDAAPVYDGSRGSRGSWSSKASKPAVAYTGHVRHKRRGFVRRFRLACKHP